MNVEKTRTTAPAQIHTYERPQTSRVGFFLIRFGPCYFVVLTFFIILWTKINSNYISLFLVSWRISSYIAFHFSLI